METKQRRKKFVRRTPESYRKEVSEITNGEYSVMGDFVNTTTKVLHVHTVCGYEWDVRPTDFINVGTRCPKCAGVMRRSPEIYRREVRELTDGDYKVLGEYKNSRTKILHKHLVCGHEWLSSPNNFKHTGSRCPKCYSGMIRTAESYRKEVSDITNGEYYVLGDFINTTTKLLHKHNKCGHEWLISQNSFVTHGSRCPECYYLEMGGRTTESYRKEVIDSTDGEYFVLGEFINVASKMTHIHNVCGYEWEVTPNSFINNGFNSCPKCAGRVRHTSESYRKEVANLTDGEYSVIGEFTNAKTKLLHVHNVCGFVWETAPSNFATKGTRCPRCCANGLKTNDRFIAEVNDFVGDEYTFLDEYTHSRAKLRVLHKDCGRVYMVTPSSFLRGARCINCVYSRGEKAVADVLDSLSIEYTREHTFEYLGRKRFDFYIPSLNIAIEYDGEQHFKAVDHWGGEEALKRTQESDALKNDFCEFMGIDLLRIPHWEFDNIDEIVTNFIDTTKLMRSISANGPEMAKCR